MLLLDLKPTLGHQLKYWSISSSIRVSRKMPKKKWQIKMTQSPFRLYQAQISAGIFLGMIYPSSVTSSARDWTSKVPEAEKRIP